jgi:fermentation-respiration switch protein FrsA (DUF1100 family)
MEGRTWKRWVLGEWSRRRIARSVVEIYLLLLLAAVMIADRLIFRPPPASYHADKGMLRIPTADGGTIAAIYRPRPTSRFTLLVSHGNAEDLGHIESLLSDLGSMGFGVFAYDYRGYGASEGKPSESHVYADVDAAYDYLTGRLDVDPSHIIAYGRSLGTGPSVDLAARKPVGAVVLDSPFVSTSRVMTRWPLFPFDRFPNLAKIGRINKPLLVVHGRQDTIVPFWHGERLYEEARPPKLHLWVDAGHVDAIDVARDAYEKDA